MLLKKSYEQIVIKFYRRVGSGTIKNWLNFGGDLSLLRWVNEQNNTLIVVAWPERAADNDPKALELHFHHQSSTFITAYCQAATNLVDQDWGQYQGNDRPALAKEVCALRVFRLGSYVASSVQGGGTNFPLAWWFEQQSTTVDLHANHSNTATHKNMYILLGILLRREGECRISFSHHLIKSSGHPVPISK